MGQNRVDGILPGIFTTAGGGGTYCRGDDMLTYQDFLKENDRVKFIATAIEEHRKSDAYKIALDAELYDRQQNSTINNVVRTIYTKAGIPIEDPVSSNNKIASNYFHRLNTDRVSYLLGNGVSFTDHVTKKELPDGTVEVHDETKEAFGDDFDTTLYELIYSGEISGKSYAYVTDAGDGKREIHLYKLTEFVPLLDEYDGTLRAGIRFWCLEWGKRPVSAVLYEEDGFTEYRTKKDKQGLELELYAEKRNYNLITSTTEIRGTEVIGGENPFGGKLPIVPYYAAYEQSTLVGLKASIDAYDLIASGFANDLKDVAQVYWLIGGALGTSDEAVNKFRERLLFQHIGVIDQDNSTVTPYVQEIPHEARKIFLDNQRASLYEGFGGLDIKQLISGDRTATEIDANYNPIDQEADRFETRVTKFIRSLLALVGIKDVPTYKRNKVINQLEQTQAVMMAADVLSRRMTLKKLPFMVDDEVEPTLAEKAKEIDETLDGGDE